MAELGGPLKPEDMPAKVRRDAERAAADVSWIKMIVPDPVRPEVVAGSVVIWSHATEGEQISEIGWMVLPEFQGRGLAKGATRMLLERARDADRWGVVHAYPGVTNAPSNGICRALGFTRVGEQEVIFNERRFRTNHWLIDPRSLPVVPAVPGRHELGCMIDGESRCRSS